MFNASQINNTNIPSGTATGGFNAAGAGVYNEFATPTIDDGNTNKRDTVKLFLISALILVVILAIVSYFYTSYLDSQVEAEKSSLSNLDSNPNIATFDKNLPAMRDLSKKLKLLNSVNDSRVYISGMLFPLIESIVESSRTSYVYFNKIDIKKDSGSQMMSVSVGGMAQDYLALSRQITNFKSGPLNSYFSNFKFDSFSLDPSGQVSFSFSFKTDISTNSYLNFLKNKNNILPAQQNTSGTLFKNDVPANVFSSNSTTTATSTNKDTTSNKNKTN